MLNDLIQEVAWNLDMDNAGCIDERDQKRIHRAIARTFDKFSIDGRKLNVIDQVEFCIDECKNRYTIGKEGDLLCYTQPHAIYYAAWKHHPSCGCQPNHCCDQHSGINYWIAEQPITVNTNVNQFHLETLSREHSLGLPCQMWYQRGGRNGEIVFDSIPYKGSVLMLIALLPFDVRLLDNCCDDKKCDVEYEFVICPAHRLDCDTQHRILCDAERLFDGNECWHWHTTAETCEPCPEIIDVKVSVRKCTTASNKPIESCGELPDGYFGALTDIVTYEAAKPKDRNQQIIDARNKSINLLHRLNNRERPIEHDPCLPWVEKGETVNSINDLSCCG